MKKFVLAVLVSFAVLCGSAQAAAVCGRWELHKGQSVRFDNSYALNSVSFTTVRRKQVHRRFYAFGTTSWQAAYGSPGSRWDAAASSGESSLGPWFKAADYGTAPLIVHFPCS